METWTKTCGLPLLLNFEPHPYSSHSHAKLITSTHVGPTETETRERAVIVTHIARLGLRRETMKASGKKGSTHRKSGQHIDGGYTKYAMICKEPAGESHLIALFFGSGL